MSIQILIYDIPYEPYELPDLYHKLIDMHIFSLSHDHFNLLILFYKYACPIQTANGYAKYA